MKNKLTLWVDEDEQRILEQALKMHQQRLVSAITDSDFQREFVQEELEMTEELLHQVEIRQHLVALPTITKLQEVWERSDCRKSFYELQKGDISALVGCSSSGEQIQVVYDDQDHAFSIMVDGVLQMKNQEMTHVLNRFRDMVSD